MLCLNTPTCGRRFQAAGDRVCPFCGSEKIEIFGDAEDIDATENEYTDQFKKEGVKSGLIGSGMKEVRADFDPNDRGEVQELEPEENWEVDTSKLPDILLPEIPE